MWVYIYICMRITSVKTGEFIAETRRVLPQQPYPKKTILADQISGFRTGILFGRNALVWTRKKMKFCKKYQEYMQGQENKLPRVGFKKFKKILKRCRRDVYPLAKAVEDGAVVAGNVHACSHLCTGSINSSSTGLWICYFAQLLLRFKLGLSPCMRSTKFLSEILSDFISDWDRVLPKIWWWKFIIITHFNFVCFQFTYSWQEKSLAWVSKSVF